MNNQKQDDGSEGAKAAIAVIFMIGLLIGVYYALRAGKKKDEDGGEDSDAAGPVTGGGLSQTQTQVIPPGADVDLDVNTPFMNSWAVAIDAGGSILLDRLRQTLEDKLRGDEDGKARAADDAKAQADAEAARLRAEAEAARLRAEAEAARLRAEADAKARTDAEARSQIEAEKARAEGRSVDASNRTVNDLDADGRPPPPDADGRPPPPGADGTARGVIASENVNAMAAEEEFARNSAEEGVRPTDRRRSVVPEVRSAMADKVQSLEGEARKGANKGVGDMDAADKAAADKAAADKAAADKAAADKAAADKAAADKAAADKAAADKAAADKAAADAVRRQTRNALDVDAKAAAEEKVRTKAAEIANLDKPRPPSLLARLAKNSARGPLGSAETTKIVEMGRPTQHPDTGLMDPDGPRSHPLDYNGRRSSSWGKMPSEVMKRSGQYIRNVGAKIQRSMAKKPMTLLEADTKAMMDSKVMARSAGTSAAKQAGMAAVSIISKLDLVSDLTMIVQVFCDAFFYGAFPDESTLITPKTVKGIQEKSVKAQIDSTTDYNKLVDDINATLDGYAYARAQWPVIIGPLDDPTEHRSAPPSVASKYPEYENQQRVQAEIDAVRENLLRTTYSTYWISCFGQAAYTDVTSNVADALVNYVEKEPFVDPTIPGIGKYTQTDRLYREAFTRVCLYHGGVVYEDVRPAADPHWGGRPRFQCSWANLDLCEASANNWIDTNGSNGDNYGEWYTFDELNVSLSNITGAPPASTGIVGCHGTDTSTYRNACGIEANHPLRNGKTGACIISTPAVASICRTNAGTYVSAEHRCVFSEEYCQSIGTCFDRTEKMCYLPGEAMFAVSMVFGTGGPREWIKVNGCNFASSPTDGFYDIINVTPLGLFTKQGQTFMADMIANHENWNEGMKQTLGNPAMIATIAGVAVMFAVGSDRGGTAIASGLTKAGVDVTGEKGKKKVGRAQTGVGLLLMAVAIGISIGVMTLDSQEEQNKGPPDPEYGPYASEYTVGGWEKNIGTSPPMTLGFNDGWVTRPIKVHTLGAGWPQTLTPSKKVPTLTYITENVQDIPANVSEKRFYEAYDLDGWLTFHANDMSKAVKSYTSTLKPPVNKKLCYTDNKIRAGARATDNQLFCMDPFPPVTYRDNINIGELAPDEALTATDTSRSYMTSRTWTDGKDPTTPQYPFDAVKDNNPEVWHYQLVYDKHNMVGMTPVTDEDGVTYIKGYPTALWETELLQFYFLDSTIQEMRQYYCIQGLIDKPDGSWDATTKIGVDPKCWGYLNVAVPGYKYTPMTMPGIGDPSATTQATLTAAAPTDAPPSSDPRIIARSIPSPQMILVYYGYYSGVTVSDYISIVSLTPRAWVIGDTLTTDSAVSLGYDPLKGAVKIIGSHDGFVALISREQTRAAGSPGRVNHTITTTSFPNLGWYANNEYPDWLGTLNLATLLALADTSAATQTVLASSASSIIAKSVPSPMITLFFNAGAFKTALDPYVIGDALSDASIIALGLDPSKKPVKKIDAEPYYIAVVHPTQTRTPIVAETTGNPNTRLFVLQTTAGAWPTGIGDSSLQALMRRLNLTVLLAS